MSLAVIDFKHQESHMTNSLGLNKDDLRQLRKTQLREGVDWIRRKKRVLLSDGGLAKLRVAIDLPRPNAEAVSDDGFAKKAAPSNNAEHTEGSEAVSAEKIAAKLTLRVLRADWPNEHIITAYDPAADSQAKKPLRVWVRSNKNFCRNLSTSEPMEFEAVHRNADLYDLVGNCPRWKGRW